MSAIHRVFGLLAGITGLIGLISCLGAIVGCWSLHAELGQRLDVVFGRVDAALAGIGGDLLRTRDGLRQVCRDPDAVPTSEAGRAPVPSTDSEGRRPLTGMAAAGRQLGEIQPRLLRAVELGQLVNGLLDALSDLWLVEKAGIDTDRLREAADQLSILIEKTQRRVPSLAGPAEAGPADEPSNLSSSVSRIVAILDLAADGMAGAREMAASRHLWVRQMLTAFAWTSTAVLLWIGLGQLSLIVHGRGMARRGCPPAITSSSETPPRPESR